jgi:hypothetical protein
MGNVQNCHSYKNLSWLDSIEFCSGNKLLPFLTQVRSSGLIILYEFHDFFIIILLKYLISLVTYQCKYPALILTKINVESYET